MPIDDVQMTNKQHAVPQNIMDVEFKIIGELTMRQFFYLIIFGGIAYFSFTFTEGIFKWPIIIFSVGLGMALAFLPIEERGLDQWIINFFKAIYGNQQYVWRKNPEIPQAFSFESMDFLQQEIITLAPTASRRKLEEFMKSQKQDKQIDPLDIPEQAYAQMVREAFKNTTTVVDQVRTAVNPTKEKIIVSDNSNQNSNNTTDNTQINKDDDKNKDKDKHKFFEKFIPHKPTEEEEELPKEQETKKQEDITHETHQSRIKLLPDIEENIEPNSQELPLEPITPDRHSGRKFTNLTPNQGEIILPIRGERVLPTSEQEELEEDINEKAEQLKKLLEQIKKEEGITKDETQNQPETPPQNKNIIPEKTESREKEETITPKKIEQEVNIKQSDEKQDTKPKDNTILNKVSELQHKLFSNKDDEQTEQTNTEAIPQNIINKKPNIVSGVVYDNSKKVLPGVVLVIKNSNNEVVRALKTDNLGHFSITTPLTNGKYTIEIDKNNKTSLTFDIINFEAQGLPIEDFEIVGKV